MHVHNARDSKENSTRSAHIVTLYSLSLTVLVSLICFFATSKIGFSPNLTHLEKKPNVSSYQCTVSDTLKSEQYSDATHLQGQFCPGGGGGAPL